MLKSERKHIILEKVIKERIVSIEDLVQELNSSESTVRRDLDELEAENKLRRIHGGAESLHSPMNYWFMNWPIQPLQL